MADNRIVAGGPAQPVFLTNATLPPSSSPSGTQAVSIADGADAAEGAKADTSATTDTGNFSLVALFKRYLERFTTLLSRWPATLGQLTRAGSLSVTFPSDATGASSPPVMIVGSNGAAITGGAFGAGDNNSTGFALLATFAEQMAFTGTGWDRVRTATIFKTITATAAGDTAIWTPVAGKKFRLMGYSVQISGDATVTGGAILTLAFRDATTLIGVTLSVFTPAAATNTLAGFSINSPATMGNGVLSATANNALNINLSAALATGVVRINVFGTEE